MSHYDTRALRYGRDNLCQIIFTVPTKLLIAYLTLTVL